MVLSLREGLSHPLIPQDIIESSDKEDLAELDKIYSQLPPPEERYPNNIIKMQREHFGVSEDSEPLTGRAYGSAINFKSYSSTISSHQQTVEANPTVTCSACR